MQAKLPIPIYRSVGAINLDGCSDERCFLVKHKIKHHRAIVNVTTPGDVIWFWIGSGNKSMSAYTEIGLFRKLNTRPAVYITLAMVVVTNRHHGAIGF